MTKASIQQFSTTNTANTDIAGINVNTGWPPSNVGAAFRELMALLASAMVPLVLDITGETSVTLTAAQASAQLIQFTGALPGNCTIMTPATAFVGSAQNDTSGGFDVVLMAGAATTTATIPPDSHFYPFIAFGSDVQLLPLGLGDTNIGGAASVSGLLTANGGVNIAGGVLYVAGGATVNGPLTASSGLGVAGSLSVGGSATVAGGNLFVNGSAQVAGAFTVSSGVNITSGSLIVGGSVSATNVITTISGGSDITGTSIFRSGGVSFITTNTSVPLQSFQFNASPVGSITTNGSSTFFNTTSDGRLKTLDGAITESGAIIDKLRAVWFRWKSAEDAKPEPGFVAQQVAKVFPWAVTKGKGRPGAENFQPWQMDGAKFMPVVIAELQSLRRRVAELELEKTRRGDTR